MDLLTRYSVVEVVKSTGVKDNIHAFNQVFSRHGFPTVLFSDNGADIMNSRNTSGLQASLTNRTDPP